jgi:hypothetical protein
MHKAKLPPHIGRVTQGVGELPKAKFVERVELSDGRSVRWRFGVDLLFTLGTHGCGGTSPVLGEVGNC